MMGTVQSARLERSEVLAWLREERAPRLAELFRRADALRRQAVGDEVHLRGLVEVSNVCVRHCGYCGIRADNKTIERYRMSGDEILECARAAARLGYGTLVMQAGEDPGIRRAWMAELIRRVKGETALAVTLSLGERPDDELEAWREAGADRYLLRFETSDRELFERIHPPLAGHGRDRLGQLARLRALGYEVGSGVMVGIPGQSYASLADDIGLFAGLDLDMIGVGPYLPHPETPLGTAAPAAVDQAPASETMVYKVLALARLQCPQANIPSTTALATLNQASGREQGLACGANVVMPNLTPPRYRVKYEIYPGKACVGETAEACARHLTAKIEQLGRRVGRGPGGRRR